MQKRADFAIATGLFAGALALLGPWAAMDFSNQPWNNGYIYTAIARMFRDRDSMWNALEYGGSPFHYLYPPIFPTLAAMLRFLSIGRAFHIVAAIAFALGPVALYVLARLLFRSRWAAVTGALAYALFPSLLYLLPQFRVLAHPYANAPWSFIALVAYDEAPHALALVFALLAVAAAWRERWGIASILAGAVLLTSWPGAIALVFPVFGLAVARRKTIISVVGFAGAAYGVAAFWITPSYFAASQLFNRIVWRNTMPATHVSPVILIAALALVALAFWKRVPAEVALPLVWTALAAAVVIGGVLLPLPTRYLLELSAGLALLIAALLSFAPRNAALAIIVLGAGFSFRFVTHAWKFEPPPQDPHTQVAYQVATWLHGHAGDGRVMASGELDSTLSLWTDVPQVGGPGQAARNYLIFAAERQIALGCGPDSERIAELWLRALNAPWLVVHGPESREYFHWFSQPEKFAALPLAWDNGAGDRIYHLPFDANPAVVVDLPKLPRIGSTTDETFLSAYVNWAAGKRPVAVHWRSTGEADFDVNLAPGEAVLLKINNAPGWRAVGVTIQNDPIGFQLIRMPPGNHHVALRFGASWDVWLGRAITLAVILLIFARVKPICMACVALISAVIAWAVILSHTPPTARIAEDAFARIHPPLINSGGVVIHSGEGSIYGVDLAGPNVRVRIGDRTVPADFDSPSQINFRVPNSLPPTAKISVEVNGCAGNAFIVPTR